MNEFGELWSLPWHSLQSSVAERFGIVAAPSGAPRCDRAAAAPSANWLMRALSLPPREAPSRGER